MRQFERIKGHDERGPKFGIATTNSLGRQFGYYHSQESEPNDAWYQAQETKLAKELDAFGVPE